MFLQLNLERYGFRVGEVCFPSRKGMLSSAKRIPFQIADVKGKLSLLIFADFDIITIFA